MCISLIHSFIQHTPNEDLLSAGLSVLGTWDPGVNLVDKWLCPCAYILAGGGKQYTMHVKSKSFGRLGGDKCYSRHTKKEAYKCVCVCVYGGVRMGEGIAIVIGFVRACLVERVALEQGCGRSMPPVRKARKPEQPSAAREQC